jgi:hypothetical protein
MHSELSPTEGSKNLPVEAFRSDLGDFQETPRAEQDDYDSVDAR